MCPFMMKTTTKNVIYELKHNMYTPMLEVTVGGGARAPVPPPHPSESAPGRLGFMN